MALPLSLKIIAWILVILVVAFLLLKDKRRIIIILFLVTAIVGTWKGLALYNEKNPDLGATKADVEISAKDLVQAYESSDSIADIRLLGKIVEVNGPVKKVEQDEKGYYTVVLGDTASSTSIRCSMDTAHNADASKLKPGSSTVVRGNCAGFSKDEFGLGSDVILNRCAIINKKE
jgi:hypothetical protein